MLNSHRSSRVLLVAGGRSEAEVGAAAPVVRRYRLARVRMSPPAAAGAPRLARTKRS